MSENEDHARLFASTIPGNGSSSTLGSNAAQRTDEGTVEPGHESLITRETRNERCPRTPFTPEVRHEQNTRHESTGNDSPRPHGEEPTQEELDGDEQRNPEDECIEYMDNIVENFRRGEVTKLKALSQIISILDFNPSRTEEAKDAAVEYYSRTLGEVEALASSAIKRGEHTATGLRTNDKDVQRASREQDDVINELISQISRESNKPKRDLSPGRTDPDDDFGEPSNKKRRVFESEMPWFDHEEEA